MSGAVLKLKYILDLCVNMSSLPLSSCRHSLQSECQPCKVYTKAGCVTPHERPYSTLSNRFFTFFKFKSKNTNVKNCYLFYNFLFIVNFTIVVSQKKVVNVKRKNV